MWPKLSASATNEEWALAYAEAGLFVFPCIAGGKEPACTNGVHDATSDESQIRQWWENDPLANIAVAPDRSGCFVLDVDPPLGAETLASLELEHGLVPNTLTFRTPRGGLHHWFKGKCASSVGTERTGLGPKLDTRGYGGYVLVPPSIVNGAGYSTEVETEIADGPLWIAETIARKREKHEASGAALDLAGNVSRAVLLCDSYVNAGDVATQGAGGDDRTYRLACEVLNLGLSPQKAWEVIRDNWNDYCQPPWDADELAVKVRNAAEYSQNELGAWAVPDSAELFGAVAAQYGTDPPIDPVKKSRFTPLELTDVDAFAEPSWLIPGLIPERGTVQITGKQKSFKTFLALDMALGIAAGVETFGHTPKPGAVVYVAGENASALALKHVPAWKIGHQVEGPLQFFVVPSMPRAAESSEIQELIDEIKRKEICPSIVVIDTATRALRGLDENSARDMGVFAAGCEHIQRSLQCTVAVIRHTGKDPVRGGRGSNVLEGDFDTVLEVERHEKTMFVQLRVIEQRNAAEREEPFAFEGNPIAGSLVFHQISPEAFNKATRPEDPFAPSKVGAALRRLGAVGEARGVMTAVLAVELVAAAPSETVEDRSKALSRAEKALRILSRGRLAGYAIGEGAGVQWCLPDEQPTEAGM